MPLPVVVPVAVLVAMVLSWLIAELLPAVPDELEGLYHIALLLAAQAVAGFEDVAEFAVELTIKQNKNSKASLAVYGKSITFKPSYVTYM